MLKKLAFAVVDRIIAKGLHIHMMGVYIEIYGCAFGDDYKSWKLWARHENLANSSSLAKGGRDW